MQMDYSTINKMKLIDLRDVPAGILLSWLSTKPDWLREQIIKSLSRTH